jgi:hypothetical protein
MKQANFRPQVTPTRGGLLALAERWSFEPAREVRATEIPGLFVDGDWLIERIFPKERQVYPTEELARRAARKFAARLSAN